MQKTNKKIQEIRAKMPEDITYPIRINRYLFLKGYCSRRKADQLITEGQITINGKRAVLGQKVNQKDNVEISKRVKNLPKHYEYFLFHKPRGVVSHNPQAGEKSVEDFFVQAKTKNLAPVGRLDKASEGLMFITNDGRIIDRMLNPKYEHEKEYSVKVDKIISESFARKMAAGVQIEDYKTKATKIHISGDKTFSIILTEGKKHQIRRMCAALGYQVKKLKRLRIINLSLSNLFPGQSRPLSVEEKMSLFEMLGL